MTKETVAFDPGLSQYAVGFPRDAYDIIDQIKQLKQNHQKKFEFSRVETFMLNIVKTCTAFYLGCLLWGSYLHYRYKDNPATVEGNPVKDMSEEEIEKLDYASEIDYILEFLDNFDKSSQYFMKRKSRVDKTLVKYLQMYKDFAQKNNNFKEFNSTDVLVIPQELSHFESYTQEELDELKNKLMEIINAGEVEKVLTLGLYNK